MKKNIPSVILDTDVEMARKFQQVIKPIFPTVKVQNDPLLFENEFADHSPDVMFLNINLETREESFRLMEKFSQSRRPPLFYCYMDSSTPEIIAHAIENGAQDVFTRPFDNAHIATKLAKHVKHDLARDNQLNVKTLVPTLPASVNFSFKLLSVDENGMLLQGKHYISKGTRFEFTAPIILEIFGKPSLPMMFSRTSRSETDDHSYLFYLEPVNPTEAHSAALRSFIIRKKQS